MADILLSINIVVEASGKVNLTVSGQLTNQTFAILSDVLDLKTKHERKQTEEFGDVGNRQMQ